MKAKHSMKQEASNILACSVHFVICVLIQSRIMLEGRKIPKPSLQRNHTLIFFSNHLGLNSYSEANQYSFIKKKEFKTL